MCKTHCLSAYARQPARGPCWGQGGGAGSKRWRVCYPSGRRFMSSLGLVRYSWGLGVQRLQVSLGRQGLWRALCLWGRLWLWLWWWWWWWWWWLGCCCCCCCCCGGCCCCCGCRRRRRGRCWCCWCCCGGCCCCCCRCCCCGCGCRCCSDVARTYRKVAT